MKIIDVIQGSDEWFECRKCKLTASNATAIATNGAGLETYVLEIMAEYYSSAEKERYTNGDIERGKELEEQARAMYELENGVTVQQVGFVEYSEHSGCSPDGLVGEEGLVEIKCPKDTNYLKLLLYKEKAIESKYIHQVQCQMLMAGREWADLVFYNPNFKNSMLVFRVEADEKAHEKLNAGIEAGTEKIKNIINQLQ